jgi:hypothetical protein
VLGLWRAMALTPYLVRRNESQAVAPVVRLLAVDHLRVTRRLRPLLQQATAEFAGLVCSQRSDRRWPLKYWTIQVESGRSVS